MIRILVSLCTCALAACSSPLTPSPVLDTATASPVNTDAPILVGTPRPLAELAAGAVCQVSAADVHHARTLLRDLLLRPVRGSSTPQWRPVAGTPIQISMHEIGSQRMLRGLLSRGTPQGGVVELSDQTVTLNTLRFGSPQIAGWAFWEAARELNISATITVNGKPVTGCAPLMGKITGRIDLTGL